MLKNFYSKKKFFFLVNKKIFQFQISMDLKKIHFI